jgi:hypothetical protein
MKDEKQNSKIKTEHEVLFSKNKVVLHGIFAWLFYLNIAIWGLSSLLKFIIFIVTNLK